MTKHPEVSLSTDSIVTIAQKMKSQDVGSIPIVADGQSNRLVGILTDRDIVLKVVATGRDADLVTADEVMNTALVTCNEDDDVRVAIDKMADHQVRRIPVVGREGNVSGIISQADVATRVDEPETTGELVEDISR
jgi:CBS domain-containing protein